MELFKDGLTVKELITKLSSLPCESKVLVSSDEEQNTLFEGIYIESYDDGVVVLAGLSGCEFE